MGTGVIIYAATPRATMSCRIYAAKDYLWIFEKSS